MSSFLLWNQNDDLFWLDQSKDDANHSCVNYNEVSEGLNNNKTKNELLYFIQTEPKSFLIVQVLNPKTSDRY